MDAEKAHSFTWTTNDVEPEPADFARARLVSSRLVAADGPVPWARAGTRQGRIPQPGRVMQTNDKKPSARRSLPLGVCVCLALFMFYIVRWPFAFLRLDDPVDVTAQGFIASLFFLVAFLILNAITVRISRALFLFFCVGCGFGAAYLSNVFFSSSLKIGNQILVLFFIYAGPVLLCAFFAAWIRLPIAPKICRLASSMYLLHFSVRAASNLCGWITPWGPDRKALSYMQYDSEFYLLANFGDPFVFLCIYLYFANEVANRSVFSAPVQKTANVEQRL